VTSSHLWMAGRVGTAQQLRSEIRGKKVGQQVTLDVYRIDLTGHGKMIQVRVKPAEWAEPAMTLASAEGGPPPRVLSPAWALRFTL